MKGKVLLLLLSILVTSTIVSAGSETLLISGQRLVWDTEIGNHFVTWYENSGNGLHIYDLNTKQIIDGSTINNYNWDGVSGGVEVYNNYAVWHDMGDVVFHVQLSYQHSNTNKILATAITQLYTKARLSIIKTTT